MVDRAGGRYEAIGDAFNRSMIPSKNRMQFYLRQGVLRDSLVSNGTLELAARLRPRRQQLSQVHRVRWLENVVSNA
jgi:hypothetical protein